MIPIDFLVARDVEGGVTMEVHPHNYNAPVRSYFASNGKFYCGRSFRAYEVTNPKVIAELRGWLKIRG